MSDSINNNSHPYDSLTPDAVLNAVDSVAPLIESLASGRADGRPAERSDPWTGRRLVRGRDCHGAVLRRTAGCGESGGAAGAGGREER